LQLPGEASACRMQLLANPKPSWYTANAAFAAIAVATAHIPYCANFNLITVAGLDRATSRCARRGE